MIQDKDDDNASSGNNGSNGNDSGDSTRVIVRIDTNTDIDKTEK